MDNQIIYQMFKKFIVLLLCSGSLLSGVSAQQLSHQVLVPLAGIAVEGKINYTQTVGETAVEIVGCSWYVFTQGFQQPGMKFSDIRKPDGTGVKVYPNPARDFVTIELFGESARTFRVEIIDITGTIIYSDQKVFNSQFWFREPHSIENLIKGFYLVRVASDDGSINRTFKLEKL